MRADLVEKLTKQGMLSIMIDTFSKTCSLLVFFLIMFSTFVPNFGKENLSNGIVVFLFTRIGLAANWGWGCCTSTQLFQCQFELCLFCIFLSCSHEADFNMKILRTILFNFGLCCKAMNVFKVTAMVQAQGKYTPVKHLFGYFYFVLLP